MPRTSSSPLISSIDLYKTETNPSTNVGAYYGTEDGRGFRYTLVNSSTALVAGSIYQGKATDVQYNEMAMTASAIGSTTLNFTNGTTTVAANDFKDGTWTISTGTGIGQTGRILTHTTGGSGAALTATIDTPLETALDTTSKLTLRPNPWRNVVVAAGPVTAAVVGAAVNLAALSTYTFLQTKGVGAALSDATVTAAATMGLSPSAGTAGAVTKHVNQDQYLGRSLPPVMVSAKVYPVIWQLD